jgi:hypothetical protein
VGGEPNQGGASWHPYLCALGTPAEPRGSEMETRRLWLAGDEMAQRHPYMMSEVSDSAALDEEVRDYVKSVGGGLGASLSNLAEKMRKAKEVDAPFISSNNV